MIARETAFMLIPIDSFQTLILMFTFDYETLKKICSEKVIQYIDEKGNFLYEKNPTNKLDYDDVLDNVIHLIVLTLEQMGIFVRKTDFELPNINKSNKFVLNLTIATIPPSINVNLIISMLQQESYIEALAYINYINSYQQKINVFNSEDKINIINKVIT